MPLDCGLRARGRNLGQRLLQPYPCKVVWTGGGKLSVPDQPVIWRHASRAYSASSSEQNPHLALGEVHLDLRVITAPGHMVGALAVAIDVAFDRATLGCGLVVLGPPRRSEVLRRLRVGLPDAAVRRARLGFFQFVSRLAAQGWPAGTSLGGIRRPMICSPRNSVILLLRRGFRRIAYAV